MEFPSLHRRNTITRLQQEHQQHPSNESSSSRDSGDNNDKEIAKDTKQQIQKELVSISLFSFLHQAAIPFSDLVHASFLSDLKPQDLGAMGIARFSQNSLSKLYNSPLSKTTISLIASATATATDKNDQKSQERLSIAVSSALLLAFLIGVVQLFAFTLFAGPILAISGVSTTSEMFSPAVAFMRARALSIPVATLWLVATNTFRGIGDAKTPLVAALIFNAFNFICDAILIRHLKFGIIGAAMATTTAQTLAMIPFLYWLDKKVTIFSKFNPSSFIQYLKRYGKAGLYLIFRSMARIGTFSYCSRRAALLGPVAASSYSILYQLGLWITYLAESVSIATQAMLSRELAKETSGDGEHLPKYIIRKSFQTGALFVSAFTLLGFTFKKQVLVTFSKNPDIQAVAMRAMPVFMIAQLTKAFAFPMNGITLAAMDWSTAMWGMWLANFSCFMTLKIFGGSIEGIWISWAASYLVQGIVGMIRYLTGTGRWKTLKERL